jgi:hypothetical protein
MSGGYGFEEVRRREDISPLQVTGHSPKTRDGRAGRKGKESMHEVFALFRAGTAAIDEPDHL